MVRIEKIKVKDLYQFACEVSNKLSEGDVVPITKQRALAYANNPYADSDDIGLLVAYIKNRCIGYLGIMPGLLKINARFLKVYWFSTFFVATQLRQRGLGSILVKEAFSLNYDFLATSMSKFSKRVFIRSGMQEFGPLEYYTIDFRLSNPFGLLFRLFRQVLRKLELESHIINSLIMQTDRYYLPFIKNICYWFIARSLKTMDDARDYHYEEMNKLKEEDLDKIQNNRPAVEFYRGIDAINWMLEYKWTKKTAEAEPLDYRYLFCELRDIFSFYSLKVYSADRKDYKGFMVLSFSSKSSHSVLKVLDFNISDDASKFASYLVLKYASIHRASCIELPNSFFLHTRNLLFLRPLSIKKRRPYLIYPKVKESELINRYKEISLSYCDGDSAFF